MAFMNGRIRLSEMGGNVHHGIGNGAKISKAIQPESNRAEPRDD